MNTSRFITGLGLLLGLAGCRLGYNSSGNRHYFDSWNEGNGHHHDLVTEGPGFRVLKGGRYAVSPQAVFFEGTPLPGADPAAFSAVSRYYGKDKSKVFYEHQPIVGADAATFEFVRRLEWARDKNDYYFQAKPLRVADRASFAFMKNESWQHDRQQVYYMGWVLPQANPATFELLQDDYARDQHHAYYGSQLIEGADLATFHVDRRNGCRVCAADKNHLYVSGLRKEPR